MAQYVQPTYRGFVQPVSRTYVPAERFGVSAGVSLPAGTIDFSTGMLKPDYEQRTRVQAKKLQNERIDEENRRIERDLERERAKKGPRIPRGLAIGLLFAELIVFVVLLLAGQGAINTLSTEIARTERSIRETRQQNMLLQEQIVAASDESSICYKASQNLGMRPADSAHAIELTAVDTRPRESAAKTAVQAIDTGVSGQAETTAAPYIASN